MCNLFFALNTLNYKLATRINRYLNEIAAHINELLKDNTANTAWSEPLSSEADKHKSLFILGLFTHLRDHGHFCENGELTTEKTLADKTVCSAYKTLSKANCHNELLALDVLAHCEVINQEGEEDKNGNIPFTAHTTVHYTYEIFDKLSNAWVRRERNQEPTRDHQLVLKIQSGVGTVLTIYPK
ncbi:MAG: hypothetical protein LBF54_02420 [Holosporaceae bacterium]|nr:hypothetical protein [Holosporaceae bacterium]